MSAHIDGVHILIVEDNASLRDDLEAVLESEGYRVWSCDSGLAALELAHQHQFDLVVSDVRMPGMDGLEAIERLQSQQPRMASLVITGYSAEADSIRAVRLGVGDYIKKPFEVAEFLAAVARQLHRHRLEKQRFQSEQTLRQTSRWALDQLQRAEQSTAPEAVALAPALASQLGLSPQAAWLAEALVRLESIGSKLSTDELPAELKNLWQEMKEPEGSSLLAKVANVSLRPDSLGPEDSALAEALRRVKATPARGSSDTRRQLARVRQAQLQEESSPEVARQHYEQVLGDESQDAARVEAMLGMMRLNAANFEECLRWGESAVRAARALNGLLSLATSLEAGLVLLANDQLAQARTFFESCGRLARDLGQSVWEARALVALRLTGTPVPQAQFEQALGFFCDVERRFDLLEMASWLTPGLLRLQHEQPCPQQERVLTLLGRDAPSSFLRARLEGPLRLSILNFLGSGVLPSLAQDPDPAMRQAVAQRLGGGTPEPSGPAQLRITTLGSFSVFRGGQDLDCPALRSLKQRFLLCRLALAGRPLNVELLIDEFWPDSFEAGKNSLNSSVSNLRKALKPADFDHDYLKRDATGLALNGQYWIDAAEALSLLRVEPSDPAWESRWKSAFQLCRGTFLDGCYMDWAEQLRNTLDLRATYCLGYWLEHRASEERAAETLEYAQKLLELDNCSQEAYLAAMRALLWQGRPEWALRTFESACKNLRKELGLEPSLALIELQQRARLSLP
ncbi:MAG: response regulator [Vulcanimicrobiota bacterium]